ncbi:hypothetical protein GmHk_11G032645 [Glycine max]|nr:hypothetical protein GmHk_11G032645 [Glycine max]
MTTYPYTSFSPQQQQQEVDEVQFSDDKHFSLHGKILLFVFLSAFFLLFVFVLMIPWLKNHARGSHDSGTEEDSIEFQNNTASQNWFRRRRKEDDANTMQQHPCDVGEINLHSVAGSLTPLISYLRYSRGMEED